MYGVESVVHPDYRGAGVGSQLMDARFAVLRRLNLRGMIAASMIMDYHKVAQQLTPQEYVRQVMTGARFDTNLSKQIHKGFKPLGLIENYEYDPRSLNWGVAMVWENHSYQQPTLPSKRILVGNFAPQPSTPLTPLTAVGS
jgi:hypothetical protein